MSNPLNGLGKNERDMAMRIFSIMGKDTPPTDDDMKFLVNNAQPMVDVLKKSIHHRLVTLGVDKIESEAIIEVLSQMNHIAGGISFADYSITEKIAESFTE